MKRRTKTKKGLLRAESLSREEKNSKTKLKRKNTRTRMKKNETNKKEYIKKRVYSLTGNRYVE